MSAMELTCINCPLGCRLTAQVENGEVVKVEGNSCKRGETYAKQECVAPMRMITASAPVKDSDIPVSVKTASPVPKEKIFDCMQAILHTPFEKPIRQGQVLIHDVCATSVDVIATRGVE